MAIEKHKLQYYKALIRRSPEYEGIFYTGIRTTGVFCRPTCSKKKPKFENCEFFTTAKKAVAAHFRPCKRCNPLSLPNKIPSLIQTLIKEVDANPDKRWKAEDFHKLQVDSSTARRQFKRRFGMTFVEYARARRIGIAIEHIMSGNAIIDAQLATGYESSSGFREAFYRILGAAPTLLKPRKVLKEAWIDTHLGTMLAVSDDTALYFLEFIDRRGLQEELEQLRQTVGAVIIPGNTKPILLIQDEIMEYFNGTLTAFKTPILLYGSPFQRRVLEQLRKIPYGKTTSYSEIAKVISSPGSAKAVANAISANQVSIAVPCHRIVNSNGSIGSYNGGVARKQWLLNFEKGAGR